MKRKHRERKLTTAKQIDRHIRGIRKALSEMSALGILAVKDAITKGRCPKCWRVLPRDQKSCDRCADMPRFEILQGPPCCGGRGCVCCNTNGDPQ